MVVKNRDARGTGSRWPCVFQLAEDAKPEYLAWTNMRVRVSLLVLFVEAYRTHCMSNLVQFQQEHPTEMYAASHAIEGVVVFTFTTIQDYHARKISARCPWYSRCLIPCTECTKSLK